MNTNKKNNILSIIGSNIKTARILKGFTQEQIAEKLNKSVNFVSLIKRGKTGIGIITIIDLCNILDIEPNSIFNGTLDYHKNNSKDKIIVSSMSFLSNEDKQIVVDLIKYITNKSVK